MDNAAIKLIVTAGLLTASMVLASDARATDRELRIVVMDPMAAPLSCACVKGMGQRDYHSLARHLADHVGRPVKLIFEESLDLAYGRVGRNVDLIIGKQSVVRFDARQTKTPVRLVAQLSDLQGKTQLTGVVVVRKSDSAQRLADLTGHNVVLGPAEDEETHAAAKRLFAQHRPDRATTLETADSLEAAAYAVIDAEADAAVLPEFMPLFLEACGKIEPGALRVVGRTRPVPFVGVFASDSVDGKLEQSLLGSLRCVGDDAKLLAALESKHGFLGPQEVAKNRGSHAPRAVAPLADGPRNVPATSVAGWTDWRGPYRRGLSAHVPKQLPDKPRVLWSVEVTGPALAGISATSDYVVVSDKDAELEHDLFRCFDARTGRDLWTLRYRSAEKVDYTNAPRAAPVLHNGLVYLQGVWGELHCVNLKDGRVVWKTNLLEAFDAEPLTWGYSVPPLVMDEKLIVAPGAKDASIAALDLKTGEVIWKTPGHAVAYSAFIATTIGGVRQIVGYDVAGLGGWEPRTGRRLWEMVPPGRSDFHVGTPVEVDGRILVATENNATRLYDFADGRIRRAPIALNDDLAPDTCTPVVVNDRVYCSAYGELFCLDLKNNLKTVWSVPNDLYYDHTNLIAGNDRVLIWNTSGDLILIRADVDRYEVVSHLRPFEGEVESVSHPAIVGNRLYVRVEKKLSCLSLETNDQN